MTTDNKNSHKWHSITCSIILLLATALPIIYVIQHPISKLFTSSSYKLSQSQPNTIISAAEAESSSSSHSHGRRKLFEQNAGRPYDNSSGLAVAWLLSFPNSGTTFLHNLVLQSTETNVANNYGTIVQLPSGKLIRNFFPSVPVFDNSADGPFLSSNYPLPRNYILTKTHCGGYCQDCPPSKYIINRSTFFLHCLTGFKYIPPGGKGGGPGNGGRTQMVRYHAKLVKKAIHLVRDPLDNVVARFHHDFKLKSGKKKFLKDHPYTMEGFQRYCQEMNTKYEKSEFAWFPAMQKYPNVPCRAEFYKYIQWHNRASFTTQNMKLQTLVLHYDDFYHRMDITINNVLHFLEAEMMNIPPPYDYRSHRQYYAPEQIKEIWQFLAEFATDETKALIQRYRPRGSAAAN